MVKHLAALLLGTVLVACTSPSTDLDLADDDTAAVPETTKGEGDQGPAAGGPVVATKKPTKTDLFTKTFGDPKNPAVIFVHGGPGGNGVMFEETIAPKLAAKGLFAVSYDQRGSGRSPKATKKDFTLETFVQDLDNVIFTLGLEKPILMGHSWGGTLSMKYMEAHPGVVKGTILVSNPIDFPDSLANVHVKCIEFYTPRFFVADDLAAVKALHTRMFPKGVAGPFQFASEDVGATMKAAADCKLSWPAVANVFGALTTWGKLLTTSPNKDLAMAIDVQVSDGVQSNEHLFEQQLWPLLGKLKADIRGIYGDTDGLFSAKQTEQIKTTLGASSFTLVKGASHVVWVDAEEAFLDAFMKDVAVLGAK